MVRAVAITVRSERGSGNERPQDRPGGRHGTARPKRTTINRQQNVVSKRYHTRPYNMITSATILYYFDIHHRTSIDMYPCLRESTKKACTIIYQYIYRLYCVMLLLKSIVRHAATHNNNSEQVFFFKSFSCLKILIARGRPTRTHWAIVRNMLQTFFFFFCASCTRNRSQA